MATKLRIDLSSLPKIPKGLDPLRDHEELATLIPQLIELAERQFTGKKLGRKRLDAVASALAGMIDIPYLPEFVEVTIAKFLVQQAFSLAKKRLG